MSVFRAPEDGSRVGTVDVAQNARVSVKGVVAASGSASSSLSVGRNLIDDVSGFLRGKGFLIHDRDPLYTREFRALLCHAGVTSVRLPPRSPNLNAYAERFVLSIKSECLDRTVLVGERHLRRAIGSYVEHYHLERPHQGIGNLPIKGVPIPSTGVVLRRERLGGILSHYYRDAA